MVKGDLEGIGDGGRVNSVRRHGAVLEKLVLEGSEGCGAVGEDELRDWKEAVLERLPPCVDVDWIFLRWRCGRRGRVFRHWSRA